MTKDDLIKVCESLLIYEQTCLIKTANTTYRISNEGGMFITDDAQVFFVPSEAVRHILNRMEHMGEVIQTVGYNEDDQETPESQGWRAL